MNKIAITLAIVALNLSAVSCQSKTDNTAVVESQNQQIAECVDNAKFITLLSETENAQVIDIRTPEEYAGGFIEKASNINFFDKDFKEQIGKLDKSAPVLMYCQSGGRSGKALKVFKEMGFETVYELKTGYGKWPNK